MRRLVRLTLFTGMRLLARVSLLARTALIASIACGSTILGATPVTATTNLEVVGADIKVDLDDHAFHGGPKPIIAWITRSAEIVAHYYDRFPTPTLRLHVTARRRWRRAHR